MEVQPAVVSTDNGDRAREIRICQIDALVRYEGFAMVKLLLDSQTSQTFLTLWHSDSFGPAGSTGRL